MLGMVCDCNTSLNADTACLEHHVCGTSRGAEYTCTYHHKHVCGLCGLQGLGASERVFQLLDRQPAMSTAGDLRPMGMS